MHIVQMKSALETVGQKPLFEKQRNRKENVAPTQYLNSTKWHFFAVFYLSKKDFLISQR